MLAEAWFKGIHMDKRSEIKVLVACHKPCPVPEDPMYLPLHVGREGKDPIGFTGDNTGDNISARNPMFCELTGLYWAWKNLDTDVLGLVHYRRLFTLRSLPKGADDEEGLRQVLTEKQTRKLLKKYKVLVPKKRNYYIETLASHYQHTHDIRQMDTARELIARQCPEYLESFDRVMGQKGGYMFNMFIAPKPLMDDYCQWLFAILFPLVDQLGDEGMTAFEKRYPGRVSEILWNVYLDRLVATGELKREEIHAIPYMYFGRIDWTRKVKAFLGAKFLHRKYDASF